MKITEKYKQQRKTTHLQLPDPQKDKSYGENPAEPDVDNVELRRLCGENLSCLKVTPEEIKSISRRTSKQSDDDSGEGESQRHGRLTASNFGDVCKRKEATKPAPLTKRLL